MTIIGLRYGGKLLDYALSLSFASAFGKFATAAAPVLMSPRAPDNIPLTILIIYPPPKWLRRQPFGCDLEATYYTTLSHYCLRLHLANLPPPQHWY